MRKPAVALSREPLLLPGIPTQPGSMRGLALVYTVLLECLLLFGSCQALKVRGKEVQLLPAAALTSSAVLETQWADAALQVATLGDFGVDNSNELEVSRASDASPSCRRGSQAGSSG